MALIVAAMLGTPCREELRLVTARNEENQHEIQLLTNVVQLDSLQANDGAIRFISV